MPVDRPEEGDVAVSRGDGEGMRAVDQPVEADVIGSEADGTEGGVGIEPDTEVVLGAGGSDAAAGERNSAAGDVEPRQRRGTADRRGERSCARAVEREGV